VEKGCGQGVLLRDVESIDRRDKRGRNRTRGGPGKIGVEQKRNKTWNRKRGKASESPKNPRSRKNLKKRTITRYRLKKRLKRGGKQKTDKMKKKFWVYSEAKKGDEFKNR